MASLDRELKALLGAAGSSGNPAADMAALGGQIEKLSTQIHSFASRMDAMEKILMDAGVVPEDAHLNDDDGAQNNQSNVDN